MIVPGSMELPEETEARWTAEAEGALAALRDEETVAALYHEHSWVTDDSGDSRPVVEFYTYCETCGATPNL